MNDVFGRSDPAWGEEPRRSGQGAGWAGTYPERAVGERVPCSLHRNVETSLRCTRCGTPICPKCLVHTRTGARCPRCVRVGAQGGVAGGGLFRGLLSLAAGLGVSLLGGAILVAAPMGALRVLPLLLLGLLVGEVMAAVAGRRGGVELGLLALVCVLVGPLAGQSLLLELLRPSAGAALSSLPGSADSLGPLGWPVLVAAAFIAAWRAARREA